MGRGPESIFDEGIFEFRGSRSLAVRGTGKQQLGAGSGFYGRFSAQANQTKSPGCDAGVERLLGHAGMYKNRDAGDFPKDLRRRYAGMHEFRGVW
jgi:hypothetical protein